MNSARAGFLKRYNSMKNQRNDTRQKRIMCVSHSVDAYVEYACSYHKTYICVE